MDKHSTDELKHIEELIELYGKLPTDANKRRIMHLIQAHYARQEAEIRIDEVRRIPYWGTPYDTDVYGYEKLFLDNRIRQLTPQAEQERNKKQ